MVWSAVQRNIACRTGPGPRVCVSGPKQPGPVQPGPIMNINTSGPFGMSGPLCLHFVRLLLVVGVSKCRAIDQNNPLVTASENQENTMLMT